MWCGAKVERHRSECTHQHRHNIFGFGGGLEAFCGSIFGDGHVGHFAAWDGGLLYWDRDGCLDGKIDERSQQTKN